MRHDTPASGLSRLRLHVDAVYIRRRNTLTRLQRCTAFSSRTPQENAPATVLEQRVSAGKRLNKDGHLITENYVLPTTAPGGAPEHNCRYHTPRLLFLFFLDSSPLAVPLTGSLLTVLLACWLVLSCLIYLLCFGADKILCLLIFFSR